MASIHPAVSVASMLTSTVTPLSSLPTAHPAGAAKPSGASAIAQLLARAGRTA